MQGLCQVVFPAGGSSEIKKIPAAIPAFGKFTPGIRQDEKTEMKSQAKRPGRSRERNKRKVVMLVHSR